MRFYDREKETAELRKIERLSRETAQMTVVTGRRRVGKTTLLKLGINDYERRVVIAEVKRQKEK